MAYGIIHHFPGGTKAQYEAVYAIVHGDKNSMPSGQIFHAAGPAPGGWTIVAIHESKESWERFREGILRPGILKGIAGGFMAPPVESTFEIHHRLP